MIMLLVPREKLNAYVRPPKKKPSFWRKPKRVFSSHRGPVLWEGRRVSGCPYVLTRTTGGSGF